MARHRVQRDEDGIGEQDNRPRADTDPTREVERADPVVEQVSRNPSENARISRAGDHGQIPPSTEGPAPVGQLSVRQGEENGEK